MQNAEWQAGLEEMLDQLEEVNKSRWAAGRDVQVLAREGRRADTTREERVSKDVHVWNDESLEGLYGDGEVLGSDE
jgi:hypothetical protein